MPLSTTIQIPTFTGTIALEIKAGTSVVFIGANGSGKTRLGVYLDEQLANTQIESHRITAHRSLALNPNIVPPSLEIAQNRLLYGNESTVAANKRLLRYGQKPATILLSDFDHLLGALYAENTDVSIAFRALARRNPQQNQTPTLAKIDILQEIWNSLLPHRQLIVEANNLSVMTPEGDRYSAAEMSDGERVIFYLIGQALLAKPDTLLIFDEPELHFNRAILAKLWDAVEAQRPDCCFLYITHDVDFAGSRRAATKFALRSYHVVPSIAWDMEPVASFSPLPDDIVAIIIGSRQPVLFVEGDGGSLDIALYRRVYDGFTVLPVGSCDQVIHTVATFAARQELHRVGCAGLVDADGRTAQDAEYLGRLGVYVLPVSEVENLLLLPRVFEALAAEQRYSEAEAQAKLVDLRRYVFAQATRQTASICLRHTTRRIDAAMKKIGLTGSDIATLDANFRAAAGSVDPKAIFNQTEADLTGAIAAQDYVLVLRYFDNKGLLSEVARLLQMTQKSLEEFVGRILRSDTASSLHGALKSYLPTVVARP